MADSTLAIVVVHPELLGTYGDGGNAVVLAQRLRWRGIDAEVLQVPAGDPLPESAAVYCIGGGEDGPQSRSADELLASGALGRAVDAGAAVLAVCAGFQIVGTSFPGVDGRARPGVGLIDVVTRRSPAPRAVGEVVSEPAPATGLPVMTGYENHQSVTALGPGIAPLGRIRVGSGNGGDQERLEGALSGRVLCTYLHGPVLARNPAVADLILGWAAGPLGPLDDAEIDGLRRERLAVAAREAETRRRRWRLPFVTR